MSVADIERKAALKNFAERMGVWAAPFKCPDPAALKAEYVDAMAKFDASTIKRAFDEVRDDWTKNTWPPVGLFVAAAKGIRSKNQPVDNHVEAPATDRQNREREADHVILATADGAAAQREGWWWSLWQHIAIHGTKYEFESVRQSALDAQPGFNRLDALAPSEASATDQILLRVRKASLERKALCEVRLRLNRKAA